MFEVRQLALGIPKIRLTLMQPIKEHNENHVKHFTTFGDSNDRNIPLHQKLVLPKGERQNVDIAGLVVKNSMQCFRRSRNQVTAIFVQVGMTVIDQRYLTTTDLTFAFAFS